MGQNGTVTGSSEYFRPPLPIIISLILHIYYYLSNVWEVWPDSTITQPQSSGGISSLAWHLVRPS